MGRFNRVLTVIRGVILTIPFVSSNAFSVDGFRQFKWGISKAAAESAGCKFYDFSPAKNRGRITKYTCLSNEITFEGRKIRPSFIFSDDRLVRVWFSAGVVADYDRLAEALKAKYGRKDSDGVLCVKRFTMGFTEKCVQRFDKDGSVALELYTSLDGQALVGLTYWDPKVPVNEVMTNQLKDDI